MCSTTKNHRTEKNKIFQIHISCNATIIKTQRLIQIMPHFHEKLHQAEMFAQKLPWVTVVAVLYAINAILILFMFSLNVAQWFTNVAVTGWLSPYFWWIFFVSLAGIEIVLSILVFAAWLYRKYRKTDIPHKIRSHFAWAHIFIWLTCAAVLLFLFGFAYDWYNRCLGFFAGSTNVVLGVAYDANVSQCYDQVNVITMANIIATAGLFLWNVMAYARIWHDPHMFMGDQDLLDVMGEEFMSTQSKKPSKTSSLRVLGKMQPERVK